MPADRSNWFVSTEWLAEHLDAPDVVVVDGSWYLPPQKRDPAAEYRAGHIPGAVRFDIDAIADTSSGLPHMLPSAEAFAAAVRALGIGDGMRIVVYDGAGLFSAPRVWWTFRVFGAPDVRILDGGLPKWVAEGRPLETGDVTRQPRTFTPRVDRGMVRDLGDMRRAIAEGTAKIVDARPGDRFRGEAPEPRPGLASGHMPGALNLPFSSIIRDGRMLDASALKELVAEAGIDPAKPIVTSCGSGVSAASVWLALEMVGAKRLGLYDGSWAEYGALSDAPVETGPARS
jgi:thiosulfate/3-mercaptopyruvate sulfurtransferase